MAPDDADLAISLFLLFRTVVWLLVLAHFVEVLPAKQGRCRASRPVVEDSSLPVADEVERLARA